mmetsp:Transcript_15077/g.24985  ORF Transcript_15077/g.24985 Transcript_15077/m.24985 type:complete len:255 (-) Transcript_15077:150-914(-)
MTNSITQWLSIVRLDGTTGVLHGSIRTNDTGINVRTRTKIVKDTSQDGSLDQVRTLLFRHIIFPSLFKDRHGSQRSRSHGSVRQLASRSVRIDLVDMRSIDIAATKDESRRDVSLVPKKHTLEQSARRHDTALTVRLHAKQLEATGNNLGCFFRVGSSTSSAAVHVGSEVVDLFAVLLGDFAASSGASVSSQDDAILEDEAHNGGSSFGSLRKVGRSSLCCFCHHLVAVHVVEREARRSAFHAVGVIVRSHCCC